MRWLQLTLHWRVYELALSTRHGRSSLDFQTNQIVPTSATRTTARKPDVMTKEDMISMLRGVGCDENTITAMSNAYDLGFEYAKDTILALPVVELPLETK